MPAPAEQQSPQEFPDSARETGMRWITWDGVLAKVFVLLTSGVFLTGFALKVGASEALIGVLAGLPRLSQLMQPLGAYFVERWQMRKKISVWVFGPARLVWLFVVILPLLGYAGGRSHLALAVLFAVALGSGLMTGFASCSWMAWMAELIPADRRGAFFGRRTMLAGVLAAFTGYLAGKFVDYWEAGHGEDDPIGLLLVFAVALIFGLASWYTLVRCPEPPIEKRPQSQPILFGLMLREAWADGNFRRFVYAIAMLSFGVWTMGPFYSVYMIETLELPYSTMNLLGACSAGGSLLMVQLLGRLSDHFGNRPVLLTCLLGVALVPTLWLFSAGGAWWPLIIAHFVGGAVWAGVFLAQMNLVFKITPEKLKSVYIGIFYALTSAPSLISPVLGGLFLQHTGSLTLGAGPWTFTNYHVLMVVSTVIRFAAIPIFHGVKEPEAKRVVHMMRVLSHVRSLNPVLGLQHYVHVVSDVATNGKRRAGVAVKRTADRLRNRRDDDKLEGPD